MSVGSVAGKFFLGLQSYTFPTEDRKRRERKKRERKREKGSKMAYLTKSTFSKIIRENIFYR